jgi:NTE family protein
MSWALVLSGMGTTGLSWQTGLLAGLHDGGVVLTDPDLVVGTSAGAIVGARIACGVSPVEALASEEAASRAASSVDEDGTGEAAVREMLGGHQGWPDRPLQITALDLGSGKLVVWTRSAGVPLADAVASSCGAPSVGGFKKIDGRFYSDAGPVSATNAQLAAGHRLVIVIAGCGPQGPLADECAQLRAGGSHVRVIVPDSASTEVLFHNLRSPGRRAAAAKAGYAQGAELAAAVGESLRPRNALVPKVDVEDLAARFVVPALRKAEWTHVAHLAVGAWHVDRYGPLEALIRLRDGIRRLNESHGNTNTATAGYHETITAAYVTLLAAYLDACPPELPLPARVDRLLASPLAGRDMLFSFYSRERLLSIDARARWVEPDLAPLDLSYVAAGL